MKFNSVKIRPFNVGGVFEVKLPNGKVILIDPYFTGNEFEGGSTREDVTGADYILLTHSHFDHDIDLGYFVEKFHSLVFCGSMSAEEVLKFHKIPYDNMIPVYPNCHYNLPDFRLDTFQAKHNPNGGKSFQPDGIPEVYEKLGVSGHERCDQLGSIESFDFMITTPSNFKILMASGRVIWDDLFDICKEKAPNVLLRQAGIREAGGDMKTGKQIDPPVFAELLAKYHAQIVFPFHHDVLLKRWGKEKTSEYFAEVDKEYRKFDPSAAFIDPQEWKWYDIGIDVSIE